jgi:hypothetical protein
VTTFFGGLSVLSPKIGKITPLFLQHIVDGITSNHLKRIIVDVMVSYGGLIQEIMVSKFITFGVNGVNVLELR